MIDQAAATNQQMEATVLPSLLSAFGRRIFFPRGIVAQSAEASRLAKRYNATAGVALSADGQPLYLSDAYKAFDTALYEPKDIFSYAPTGGDAQVRSLWQQRLMANNPALRGLSISVPMVTAGLTHALSVTARLFIDEGDTVVVPSLRWDNYDLIFSTAHGARMQSFPFFTSDGLFNEAAFASVLSSQTSRKLTVLLNFPNNPTGYTPDNRTLRRIAAILTETAASGHDVLVVCDDAYYGLFYEENMGENSLFALLADAHPRLLAIKCDGPTKEDLMWGFRLGFITCGGKGIPRTAYEAFEQKLLGTIRCTVSSSQRAGQSILSEVLVNGAAADEDRRKAQQDMKERYQATRLALKKYGSDKVLVPYPFNSGYFFAFKSQVPTEQLRRFLLEDKGIGTISLPDNILRVAFCSVAQDDIPDLIDSIYRAAHDIAGVEN